MCLPKKLKGSTIQAIAVLIGSILSLNFGLIFGIAPGHGKLYASKQTPLKFEVTQVESTWLASSLFFSAALGSIVLGPVSSKIGQKSVLILSGLLQTAGWLCIHFGNNILHIYSSRIFAGVAAGAALTTLPLYIYDITDSSRRNARFTVSIECWRNFGILVGFIMSTYLQYELIPIVGFIVSVVFINTFPFVQESPFYYLRSNNMPKCEKSLRWFRGIRSKEDRNDPNFVQDFRDLKLYACDSCPTDKNNGSSHGSLRLFLEGLGFMVGAHLSGTYVFFTYGPQFFRALTTNTNLPVDIVIMLLAAVQLIGSILARWICASVSRRLTIFASSFGSALCLISLIVYLSTSFHLKFSNGLDYWLLLAFAAGHVLFANIGSSSFHSLILTENYPRRIKCQFLSLLHSISWLIIFVLIQFYEPLVQSISAVGLLAVISSGSVMVTLWSLYPFAKLPASENKNKRVSEEKSNNGNTTS